MVHGGSKKRPAACKKKIAILHEGGAGHGLFSQVAPPRPHDDALGVRLGLQRVRVEDCEVTMVIWDIAGDVSRSLETSYLRGAAGVVVVLDGARANDRERQAFVEACSRVLEHPVLITATGDDADVDELLAEMARRVA